MASAIARAGRDRAAAPHGRAPRSACCCLILAEISFFAIFVVAYLFYIGKSLSGPQPEEVLTLPILATICLLSSSATIVLATRSLTGGRTRPLPTALALTIVARRPSSSGPPRSSGGELIEDHGLTIRDEPVRDDLLLAGRVPRRARRRRALSMLS